MIPGKYKNVANLPDGSYRNIDTTFSILWCKIDEGGPRSKNGSKHVGISDGSPVPDSVKTVSAVEQNYIFKTVMR